MNHDVGNHLAGKPAAAVELLHAFRRLVLAAGECEERVHPSEVAWADNRAFATAFIKSGRLEVSIDLPRQVDHPALLQAFPTTKRVVTHRLPSTRQSNWTRRSGPGSLRPTAGR